MGSAGPAPIASIATIALGTLALGGGVALEIAGTSDEARLWGRLGMAAGVGWGVTGFGTLALRSEEERLADLWKKERPLPVDRGASSLRIRPLVAFGALGIGGTF